MAFHSFSSIVLATTIAILYKFSCNSAQPIRKGFSIELIHRDSPLSPFHNSSLDFSQRLGNALRRSLNNAKRFKTNSNMDQSMYQTKIIPDHGEYLMNISFGNPSQQVLVVADTASDLSWIQCKPCKECYKYKGFLFNPKNSSTYKTLHCNTWTCQFIYEVENNCSLANYCQYYESYGDGSFSHGLVATDTVTIGEQQIPDIFFGCGSRNGGIFKGMWSGVVGLGGGELSFVSQISSLIDGKFSYCLVPFPTTTGLSSLSSRFNFGGVDFGSGAVSTPLVRKSTKTFYYLTLEGISVGGQRLNFNDYTNSSDDKFHEGNIIIDSGTTLTMLPHKLYNKMESIIEDVLNLRTLRDPQKVLNLCYNSSKVNEVPKITMHFKGADVELSNTNTFVDSSAQIMCLVFAPAVNFPVYGNLAQMNFLVGYDLEKNIVSFKPMDCTKL